MRMSRSILLRSILPRSILPRTILPRTILPVAGFALACLAAPGLAQDLRPAPAYFVNTVFDLTVAQALARSCTQVSLDPVVAGRASDALLAQLDADGFDLEDPQAQMSGAEDALLARRTDFMSRYELTEPTEADVCAAARAEMAQGSDIGSFLVEVPG